MPRLQSRHSSLVRRHPAALFLTVLSVLVAACGSTVPLQGAQGAATGQVAGSEGAVAFDDGLGAGGDDGLSAGEGGAGPTGGAGSVDPATASGGTTTAGAPGSPGGSQGSGPGGATTSGGGFSTSGGQASGGPAKGLTGDTIKIGLEYVGDATEANAAIGANVSSGDDRRNFDALLDHYNKSGGAGGRTIEPVYYEYTASTNIDEQQNTSCAKFTQDDPVYAVFVLLPENAYLNCLSKGGVATWGYPALSGADDQAFAQFPLYVQPSALSLSAAARLTPPGLQQVGYFEPEAVDGSTTTALVTFDDPRFRRAAEREFEPALQRIGETLDERQYVTYAKSTNDVGRLSAEMSSAILRFREAGVDHVMFLEYNALIAFSFLQAAERQNYRPQYGFNSTSGGQLLIDTGLAPEAQLVNSRLVGWQPTFDVPPKYTQVWPEQRRCLAVFEDAGIQFEDNNARGRALLQCTGFEFLRAALDAASGASSITSIVQGAERLGSGWVSPWNKTTRFGPGRHYGTSVYLTAAHDQECNCFVPKSRTRPIP
jgi:hypothetical protein